MEIITYILSSTGTGSGTGLLSCAPRDHMGFEEGTALLKARPNDIFMHKYLLHKIGEFDLETLRTFVREKHKMDDVPLLSLACEACLINPSFESLLAEFTSEEIQRLARHTPLIYLSWYQRADLERDFYWLRIFSQNLYRHQDLPSPDTAEISIPFGKSAIDQWKKSIVPIRELFSPQPKSENPPSRSPSREIVKQLIRKLERVGLLSGWEMRPDATLSPFAVERPWNLDLRVEQGRNRLRLTGTPTSYGRGLNIHQARLSYAMEAVERCSAFAGISSGRIQGCTSEYLLKRGSYSQLLKENIPALDPNEMCLEVPYRDQGIHWVTAQRTDGTGSSTVHVPVQFVLLFSNLDEPSLTSGIPSTGFAAGRTVEEAKLAALLEVIERDAEKVMPYTRNRCFLLQSDDRRISDTIEGLSKRGIQIQFLDITSEFGLPCYKAFVQGPNGAVLKGTAADLDGRRAVVSAMTEIPYPYPYWFGAMAPSDEVETIQHEDLPDYSSGDNREDLYRVETLLIKNGYRPLYVDLTREDLEIPVVKCLVPGLEMMTVFDRFTPLGLRKFGHYPGMEE